MHLLAQVLEASSTATLAALKTLPVTPCVVHPEAQPSTQCLAPVLTGTTPQITIVANSTNISASTVHPKTRKGHVTAEVLAKRWNIGLETVRKTVDSTTQLAVRDFTHTTGGRRLKPYAYQLRYPRMNAEMYTDILIGRCKSLSGNRYAQVYATPFHWVTVIPIPLKSDAHLTLNELFRKVGVPRVIIPDNAKELTEGDFKKKALRAGLAILPVEAYTKNANLAEDAIQDLKRVYRRTMIAMNLPEVLWGKCLVYLALVR
jgi:hypothetical protein